MNDFLYRLRNEFSELVEKCDKLSSFIDSEKFNELPILQQRLLVLQHQSMIQYKEILNFRLLDLAPESSTESQSA